MISLTNIQKPVEKEWIKFNELFAQEFQSKIPLLNKMLQYILEHKGKQLRPLYMLLLGKVAGKIPTELYHAAIAFELVHTGSLIHDDIVDEAKERHNSPALNIQFTNSQAVLVGDYFMSRSMSAMLRTQSIDMYTCLANVGQMLTEGELIQQDQLLNSKESVYLKIIHHKTAALFEECARAVSYAQKLDAEESKNMVEFGYLLGMVFQMKDDTFDYINDAETGKPAFNDIQEQKITLPLIHALQQAPQEEKEMIIDHIISEDITPQFCERLTQFVQEYKGVEYTTNLMLEYRNKAAKCLELFKDSASKTTLLELFDFVIQRNK